MKKLLFATVFAGSLAALAVTLYLMLTIYSGDQGMSGGSETALGAHSERVVVISQEQGSYVMDEIEKGARTAAAGHGMMIDFWGVYRSNDEELLKQIDIAIASKVDGIILEGADRPDFVRLVNKATEKGIPVITINSDAPGSLRKTYIGSNHYQEGILMGQHLAQQLHGKGTIGVITNAESSDTDQLRLKGLREVLDRHAGVKLVFASEDASKLQASMQTFDILNHVPDVIAFIGLPADSGKRIVEAVDFRSRRKDSQVFMFDASPQTKSMIKDGLIQAGLSQHYEDMGKMSVDLLQRWLDSERLPLDPSYYTPISVVGPADVKEEAP
ncbi:substrate-binding domain-containing protein [Paenibacillus sacheonensis]|uniref:Substrate-binding domain-containing protein n=1 Tax=Paenibacillus sacheonensis TaxID=742054 RepID=A0A7X5BWY2_9BACL|nr:substrate-binding domain-containing protein [Paenibacillus sacheonensis]MBM7563433.1 ribose transport system substrate-binding protein [Paenibacillus sacheonensis]NBC68012.1 substrate-binding domain-containing protein [Paenibacillus sacheonensis]